VSDSREIRVEILSEVPAHQRRQIVSGMRWTVWLSALAMPFSYGTTILLARISPEAVGTYGLLMVYIAVVQSVLYLGGDAVTIKFLPEIDASQRLSFLVSYFLVICAASLPWLMAASLWAGKLHYLFGNHGSTPFQLAVLFLFPICILGSLSAAALKGLLEISWAQILTRFLTIGFFVSCGGLFLWARPLLATHYTQLIWGIYLGLTALAAFLGFRRLKLLERCKGGWRSLHFFLPRGFWKYTLSLQQLSFIGFFSGRLDVVLVLNFGNLTLLGKYVAIIALVETIRLINRYLLDTLLPSLTNMVAMGNLPGASDVLKVHARIIFLVNTATTCGLILLAGPLVALLGPKYTSLVPLVILLSLLVGLAAPGNLAGTMLSSVGKQQRAVWLSLGQVGLYVLLFLSLWSRWHLLGAVLAYGISWLLTKPPLLAIASRSVPFRVPLAKDYVMFAIVAVGSAALEHWEPLGLGTGLAAWVVAMFLFLFLGQYSIPEILRLIRCFVPVSSFFPRAAGNAQ